MTAIALDDEPPALKVIEEFCRKTDSIDLQKCFTKPTEALKHIRKFPVDLLFLDIEMPSLTGIQFMENLEQDLMVIFTTAHSRYAVEGFNLNAVDYLLKPFTYQRFEQAANKAKEQYHKIHQRDNIADQYLFIRADYTLLKVAIADIIYVEGLDDYLKIHLPNRSPIVARMTMKVILQKLPAKEFIRVHRSFIVPISKIQSIRSKSIVVEGVEIPIGTSYHENFFNHFQL